MTPTVVPTKATVELARAMIAEARRQESGAEAVILRFDECHPEQVPALVGLLLEATCNTRNNCGTCLRSANFGASSRSDRRYPQVVVDNRVDSNKRSSDPRGMALVDGCPSCVLNTEPPVAARPTRDGWACDYVCTDCGHAWTTDWRT